MEEKKAKALLSQARIARLLEDLKILEAELLKERRIQMQLQIEISKEEE